MCGLIGVVAREDSALERRVMKGLSMLRWRGPNHQKVERLDLSGANVWLGHARLAIIDLGSEANQPMRSVDDRYMMIFNGEIYNYIELREKLRAEGVAFRTNSDTEVLLNAWQHWGEECLQYLDGMFAFVIADKVEGTLTCVRDPFGIKPFYYAVNERFLAFASELPAILALLSDKPKADLQQAYDYLVHGDYDCSEKTFVDGVRNLPPAHMLIWDVGNGMVKSIKRWWMPSIEQKSHLSFNDAAEAVRNLFLQNIQRQLRSDVSIGAALSGGIDSSAVVCGMRHLEPDLPIHTFSFIASESRISEERWVDKVNKHVGATQHKTVATASDLLSDIDDLVRSQGEPFGSTSIYAQYRVFKMAQENGITVTLDGQGADELLGGYSGYPGLRAKSMVDMRHHMDAVRFVKHWRSWRSAGSSQAMTALIRAYSSDRVYELLHRLQRHKGFPAWVKGDIFREAGVSGTKLCSISMHKADSHGRRLISFLAESLQGVGLPGLLRHGDRNSMRFSVESRVPFLTTEFCNLLYSFPEEYLVSPGGETKSVFRAAMRGIVPDEILDRRDKIGFATPEHQWFMESAKKYRGWLKESCDIAFLDSKKAIQELDSIVLGKSSFTWRSWRLINYVKWSQLIIG